MYNYKKRKMPPASLLYTGETKSSTTVSHVQYNAENVVRNPKLESLNPNMVDWIVVEGLEDVNIINNLCLSFNVDTLVIEDILNVNQRNKIELHENYIFSVQKYSYLQNDTIKYDYISTLVFEDKLITFSECNNQFVNDIMKRLEDKKSIIRSQRHQYLYYVLNDMIVDEKYSVFYKLESIINDLEEKLLDLKREEEVQIYNTRKELLFLRNSCTQLFENLFLNKEIISKLINKTNSRYYEDLKDHILNLKEKTNFETDVINNLYQMHMNNLSHRMNSIMTTLTIFSAIFIPLSFVAGVFGMNFINFPILQNQNGILYFIILCLLVPTLMLLFFKKKKWF